MSGAVELFSKSPPQGKRLLERPRPIQKLKWMLSVLECRMIKVAQNMIPRREDSNQSSDCTMKGEFLSYHQLLKKDYALYI
jgi:hypothetical protein